MVHGMVHETIQEMVHEMVHGMALGTAHESSLLEIESVGQSNWSALRAATADSGLRECVCATLRLQDGC
jgi:hypothetical protein